MELTIFSQEFKDRFKLEFGLKVESFSSVTGLRFFMERNYEEAVSYVTAESEPASAEYLKYKRVQKLYNKFMEEFNAAYDAEEILKK